MIDFALIKIVLIKQLQFRKLGLLFGSDNIARRC